MFGLTRSKPAFYHLHIPKTAGLTIRDLMARAYGEDFCPAGAWDDFYKFPEYRKYRYAAYGGHFGNILGEFVNRKLRIFTVIREPVARTVSHYLHVKRNASHPLHHLAATQHFDDFIFDPASVPMIYNFQARYLCVKENNLDELARVYLPGWNEQHSLSVAWENSHAYKSEKDLRDGAMNTLRGIDFVTTTEYLDQDISKLQKFMRAPVEQVERKNVADALPVSISRASRMRIEALTRVDAQLYNLALKMRLT